MHIDKDFTMSIVQVHLDEIMYQKDDQIVCFFAFPQIGIVVPLQPRDTLMFNPQEPHCISLRCNKDGNLYCISSYLKTQVVGLNDNSDKVIRTPLREWELIPEYWVNIRLSVRPSVCLFVCLFICLFVCLFVCPSVPTGSLWEYKLLDNC